MKLKLTAVLLTVVAAFTVVSCAKTAPNLTPVGQHAYTADQVAMRVQELQRAAIDAEATKALPTATTRVIVQFTVAAAATLKSVPDGWPAALAAAWTSAKQQIGAVPNPLIAAAMSALDVVIAGVQ